MVGLGTITRDPELPEPRVNQGAMVWGSGDPPEPGGLLSARVRGSPPTERTVPEGFSPRRFLASRSLDWNLFCEPDSTLPVAADHLGKLTGSTLGKVRPSCLAAVNRVFPPREAAVVAAVLLGEKPTGHDPLRDGFTRLGLAHLFAVSGLHVGIIAVMAGLLVRVMRLGPTPGVVVVTAVIWTYTAMTGAAPSTVRAATMATILLGSRHAGGRVDPFHTLALVYWGLQCWNPAAVTDPGVRLSFGAVAGILVASRGWDLLAGCLPGIRLVLASFLVSLGAQTGTAIEVARSFGFLAPWAPLINIVAVPVFGGAVWLAVAGVILAPLDWLSAGPATLSWLAFRSLEAVTALLDPWIGPPPAVASYGFGRLSLACAAIVVWLCVRHRGARLGAALLLIVLPWCVTPGVKAMRAIQFDVGQGDCAALIFPDRRCVLIDTGESWRNGGSPLARSVVPWLRSQGVRELWGVVLSHSHADHVGAADQLAMEFPVRHWWLGGLCEAPEGIGSALIDRPSVGDTLLVCGDWALVSLGPEVEAEHENDRSLAVALFREGRPAGLWPGDLEQEGERSLLSVVAAGGGGWDILKAGHHGSRTSSIPEFLDWCRPGVILISCGVENRHRHPSHGSFSSVGRLRPVRRTDLEGSLEVVWEGDGPPLVRGSRAPP